MDTLVVMPDNVEDLQLLVQLLERLEIKVRLLTPEKREELGLDSLLGEVDRSDKVEHSEIIAKLNAA